MLLESYLKATECYLKKWTCKLINICISRFVMNHHDVNKFCNLLIRVMPFFYCTWVFVYFAKLGYANRSFPNANYVRFIGIYCR